MRTSQILALAAALPSTLAAYKGFNYAALDLTGAVKDQAAYEGEFTSAKNLVGTSGFTSARIYTMIQGGTTNTPIAAIPAAIGTQTTLLLGLWASAGQTGIDNEIAALKAAISQYGSAFTDLIAGISVGSEDVYRITPLGVASNAGTGATGDEIANYIGQVRSAVAGTGAAGKPVGHTDTYNVWTNSSGWLNDLISVCDFIGMDAYPYYETTKANSIGNANATFWDDYSLTVAKGKPVWITETGWPTSGPTMNEAVASVANAQTYYDEVGCHAFGSGINTWWYTLQDSSSDASIPSFGLVGDGTPPPTTPKYSLTC